MNSNVSRSIISMEQDELRMLTAEVKETVATHVDVKKADKHFSSADLWSILKGRKTQFLSQRAVLSRRSTIV